MKNLIAVLSLAALGLPAQSLAQLAPPNQAGVTFGQWHTIVRDIEASKKFWTILGGKAMKIDDVDVIKFPGVFIFMKQGVPTGGTENSPISHVGFGALKTDDLLDKWAAAGVEIDWRGISPLNGEHTGHFDTPDGVELEITTEAGIAPYPRLRPGIEMESNHLQFVAPIGHRKEEMEDWWVKNMAATPTHKGPELTAGFPGMLFTSYGGGTKKLFPTKGRAIDMVGLEVKNLEAFCRKLGANGVKFDAPYSKKRHKSFASAELTDPFGVSIELTEGLNKF